MPEEANPAEIPTNVCSAIPTSTICSGNALANGTSFPEPRESLVTTKISRSSFAKFNNVAANTSRFGLPTSIFYFIVIIFLAVFLFLPFGANCQKLVFNLYHKEENIADFELLIYKNEILSNIKSNKGRIIVDKNKIKQSDSIFIKHSFYKEIFDLNNLSQKTYYSNASLTLKDIELRTPETKITEPRGRRVDGLCNCCTKSISIPVGEMQNGTLKGIELYFPKGKYHHSIEDGRRVQSKNKKIILYLALVNKTDTVFLSSSEKLVMDTLLVKKNGWNYYDFRHRNFDFDDAEHLFISIQALDDMVIGRRRIRKNQKDVDYLNRKYDRGRSIYFIDSRLFAPNLDKFSLAYKIHYYDTERKEPTHHCHVEGQKNDQKEVIYQLHNRLMTSSPSLWSVI